MKEMEPRTHFYICMAFFFFLSMCSFDEERENKMNVGSDEKMIDVPDSVMKSISGQLLF